MTDHVKLPEPQDLQLDSCTDPHDDPVFRMLSEGSFDLDAALQDVRFVEWLSGEARERARHADRLPERDRLARGAELVARMHERRFHVKRKMHPPIHADRAGAWNADVVLVGRLRAPFVDLGVAAGIGRDLWDEMPDQWVELPPSLPDANYVALRVVGDSMTPLIHSGDTVLVRREPAIAANTVVVARHPDDGYVCKKVERLTATSVVLSSLASDGPLVVIPREPRLIIGTVVMVWCRHRSKK